MRNGIDVFEEGRGTEGVKSAPDNTFGFLVRPSSYNDDGLVLVIGGVVRVLTPASMLASTIHFNVYDLST